jgi:hypothetical protein
MPTTGDPCGIEGIYHGCCTCTAKIWLQPGLYFPRCFDCGKTVEWRIQGDVEPLREDRGQGASLRAR